MTPEQLEFLNACRWAYLYGILLAFGSLSISSIIRYGLRLFFVAAEPDF